MNQTVLKAVEVSEIKDAQNGNGKYQTIKVQQFRLIAVGSKTIEMATANTATRLLWSDRQTKDQKGTVKGDVLFTKIQKGDYVSGEISHFNTTPYEINGKTVTSFKCCYFEGENPVNVANSHLSSNFACVVDENGVPTRELANKNVLAVEGQA